jgi:hypothetical protein
MAPSVTEIVNNTKHVLNMKVGNHRYFVDFAKIRRGAKHTMQVDYSDTYQEFLMGKDRTGKNIIVTSDDCCDYQCITITEVDGKFTVYRVPRIRSRSGEQEPASAAVAKHGATWKTLWKLRL